MIGAGGTAGHVVPALAVADALRAEGAEVAFVGGERAEASSCPPAGYELHRLQVEPLPRASAAPGGAGRAVTDAPRSRGARGSCAGCAPDAVLGAGGYVAGPVGLAAVLTRGSRWC